MGHADYYQEYIKNLLYFRGKLNGCYNEKLIRQYLIYAMHRLYGDKLIDFFKENSNDKSLFKVLIDILLDESEDYSNDARYTAAYLICFFNPEILIEYKNELMYAQKYRIVALRPFRDYNI